MTAKYFTKKTLVFFIFTLATFQVFALNRFEQLTVEDGLAHTDATCILQDASGLMWIGTNAGLQSYDGYTLQTFDYYKNSDSRIRKFHNRITSIAIDNKRLWVGTKSGLLNLDLSSHCFVNYEITLSNTLLFNDIKNVYADNKNNIWVKTDDFIYVAQFNENNNTLNVLDSISSKFSPKNQLDVFSILSFGKNVLLINQDAVYQTSIKQNKIHVDNIYYLAQLSGNDQFINSAYVLNNYLYLRTNNSILRYSLNKSDNSIDKSSVKRIVISDFLPELQKNHTGKFVVDKNENLWCVFQEGLIELRSPFNSPTGKIHRKIFTDPKSLSTNFLSYLFIDRDNNLWIGTWGGGVNYLSYNESPFKYVKYTPQSNFTLLDVFVKAVKKDIDGTLWILTQKGGLNHYDLDKGLIKSYSFNNLPLANRIFKDLILTPDNKSILIGTIDGLISFDKRTEQSYLVIGKTPNSNINLQAHIYSLDIDRAGNIWAGTWDVGLLCIKKTEKGYVLINHFDKDNKNVKLKLSSNLVSHVYCDKSKNEVLVCTD